ncbi:outer membrane beta-barrel protein [bacterium]|nr:outer membrane beta-barrel protein [bacterium]
MKTLASAVALLAFGLSAANALAAGPNDPWYASASGGVSFPDNTSISGTTSGKIKYDVSSGGNLALGYQPAALNNQSGDVRFEVEGGYHAMGLNEITAGGVTNTNPKGDLKIATAMANIYYDMHTGTAFTPYVGAGIGDANIQLNKNNGLGMTDDSDNQLGYQFMAGVSYTPDSMPRTAWSLGYRYLGTTSPQYATPTGDVKLSSLHESNIEAGVRYHF